MSLDDSISSDAVLLSTFTILNERYRVYFRRGSLRWSKESAENESKIVPVRDILAVDVVHDSSCSCKIIGYAGSDNEGYMGPSSTPQHDKLVVHYAAAKKENELRPYMVVFKHEEPHQVALWLHTIQAELDQLRRPRKILAFVNPNSGKRRGERIYRKSVEPILQMAGVKTRLIVTEHANHSKDFIMTEDLSPYDAILTVGGDGTVSEVINALVRRRMADDNSETTSPNVDLPPINIPIAVIPGGSTDCVAYTMNGTLDRKTAVLYAVLGDKTGMDVCSVSSDKGFVKCFISLLGYGFLGDVLETSERYRWMGPKRYDFSGFLKLLAYRWYHCEVTMTLDSSRLPAVGPMCYRNCEACGERDKLSLRRSSVYQEEALNSIRTSLQFEGRKEEPKRVTVSGKYFWITCANISCACPRSPVGVAPFTHLGDGSMDLLLIAPRTPLDIVKLLARSTSKDPNNNFYDLPFVKTYKVKDLTFKALNKDLSPMELDPETAKGMGSSVWNCDGEIVNESNVRVQNHKQLISVLTRRCMPPAKSDGFFGFRCLNCSKNPDYVT